MPHSAQVLQQIELLRYLCRAYVHHIPLQQLRHLATTYGIHVPARLHGSESDVKRYMCTALAKALGVKLPDHMVTTGVTKPIDDKGTDECPIEVVRVVGSELLGSAGLIYVVRGFQQCAKRALGTDPTAVAPHADDDDGGEGDESDWEAAAGADGDDDRYVVIKTNWARDALRFKQSRALYGRLLQEQYVMAMCGLSGGARNVVPMYGMWSGPEGKEHNIIPSLHSPYVVMPYYAQGDLLQWYCGTMRLDALMSQDGGVGYAQLDVHSALCLMSSIFVQLAQGLVSLHARGFLHADFKTENCFVSTTGLSDAQERTFRRLTLRQLRSKGAGADDATSTRWDVESRPLWPVVDVGDLDMACGVMVEAEVGAPVAEEEEVALTRVLGLSRPDASLDVYVQAVLDSQARQIRKQAVSVDALTRAQRNAVLQAAVQRMVAARRSIRWALTRNGFREYGADAIREVVQSMCFVGTDSYLAPELAVPPLYKCRPRTLESDAWALGVTMLTLGGCSTAAGPEKLARYDGNVTRVAHRYSVLHTSEAKFLRDIINGLTRADPRKRATAASVLRNPTLQRYAAHVYGHARPAVLRYDALLREASQ